MTKVSAEQFYSLMLLTVALGITGIKSITMSDYYVGAFMLAIPTIGWITYVLKSFGYLS